MTEAKDSELRSRVRLSEKKRVALHSIIAAIFLTVLKLVVGVLTGSLGIMSEAAHSGLDFVAAVATYVSVHVSDKPADADHQYGHQKVENFSAFLQTGLLLLTCVWIVYEAVRRLFFKHVEVELSLWAFAVMAIAIVVDFFRSRELRQTARKHGSQALEADALHFQTDIWSSSVVIVGLIALWLGERFALPQLGIADPLAALAVAGITVLISVRLGRRTIDALLDAAPIGLRAQVLDAVLGAEGVVSCARVRMRHAGSKFFVDANISVERTMPFDHVPAIIASVRARIRQIVPEADVMIHTEPQAPPEDNLFEKVKWVARRSNLAVHDLLVHEVDGQLTLDLHLEVDESYTLEQAHDEVNYLEAQIFEEVPDIDVINTHIEGEGAHIEANQMSGDLRERMAKDLQDAATQVVEIIDCHDIAIREVDHKIYVSCHCLMDGSLPITLVHDKTVELESLFRKIYPSIYKVTIHTEPESERGVPATARPRRPER
ncbi:MAG: cation diffusion facilitator family transporter [Acidobacteria bacterium]|nr:cation diffusion facilitator family transporter [Acidobacteriota bacterium]